MDDLRSTLAGFDADAPLAAAPDPWDFMPTPAARPGPPWAMAEMIAAEPGLARSRGGSPGRRRIRRSAGRRRQRRRVGPASRWSITGCGTSEHAAMAVAAILREGVARSRAGRSRAGRGPGVRAVARPARRGARRRASATRVATTATIAAMAASRAAGARTALITGSAGVARGGRCGCRASRRSRWTAAGATRWATCRRSSPRRWPPRCWPAARRRRPVSGGGWPTGSRRRTRAGGRRLAPRRGHRGRRSPARRTCSSSAPAPTASPPASSPSRSRRRPGCPRRCATSRRSCTATCRRPGPETALVLVLTERGRPRGARQAGAPGAARPRPRRASGRRRSWAPTPRRAIPAALTPGGRIVVPESPDLPAAVASLLGTAGPLQLVTLAVAAARGTNPDQIRRDDPRYLRAAELADDPSV